MAEVAPRPRSCGAPRDTLRARGGPGSSQGHAVSTCSVLGWAFLGEVLVEEAAQGFLRPSQAGVLGAGWERMAAGRPGLGLTASRPENWQTSAKYLTQFRVSEGGKH